MTQVPTAAQIAQQVKVVWDQRRPTSSRVVGIRVPSLVEVGETLRVGDEELAVARCDSVLAVRERLAARKGDGEPLVLLTPVSESELGADVVSRLLRRHLVSINPWQLVKESFEARHVEPRLADRHPWVAAALLECEPPAGYPPAPGGILESETAWRFLFGPGGIFGRYGLPEGRRDPEILLEWAADGEWRHFEFAAEVREGLIAVASETAGPLSGRILAAILDEKDVLSVGLVARVLYGASARAAPSAIKASGKLESYLGGGELPEALALAWAGAAEAVVERLLRRWPVAAVRQHLEKASAMLSDFGAPERAVESDGLAQAYVQRLEAFASEIETFLDALENRRQPSLATLRSALERSRRHVLARHEAARRERSEMAFRLCAYLASRPDAVAGSFAAAARAYRDEGGFADWARTRVWDRDPVPSLSAAYGRLEKRVGEAREAENRRFGELFANWLKTGSHDTSVVGVEDVLERVVVPMARRRPVLLVLIDGMGVPVFRELQKDLLRLDWLEVRRGDEPKDMARPPAIAAVPPVSECSRASLFFGRLGKGKQPEEKKAFAKHAGLVAAGSPTRPPVLFHKAELESGTKLGEVEDTVRDAKVRVVGAVINAVDDHLAKGEQLRFGWTAESIRPLRELLDAARHAGRAVVLVSDHGHVLEHRSEKLGEGKADRWREPSGELAAGELVLEGERVLEGRIVAPWSERLRYSAKKNGYHGGAAPQEVVIPLAVLVPSEVDVDGWEAVAEEEPAWWSVAAPEAVETKPRKPSAPSRVARPAVEAVEEPSGQVRLFPAEKPKSAAAAAASWVEALLASETMAVQRRLAARTRLSDERIGEILTALDERGGKLTRVALGKRLGVPQLRVGGIVSALRRVLNVEGYAVLSFDEASGTVELNRELLEVQFGLKEGAE